VRNNQRLLISLDLDGVMANLNGVVLPALSDRTKTPLTLKLLVKWDWMKSIPRKHREWSLKEAYELYAAAWERFPPDKIKPYRHDLAEATEKLSRYGRVDVVTSHDKAMRSPVRYWLRKWKVKYRRLVMIGKSGENDATAKYGARTKIRNGYNAFIDDNPALAQEITRHPNGHLMFIYDQPWNRSVRENNEDVFRVKNLASVVEILQTRQEAKKETTAGVNRK
jgi:hypothetical protein